MRQAPGDVWERAAPLYRWQEPLEARSLARLVELLDVAPGGLVVDVGAGPGTLTRRLRAARPDAPVVAVEPAAGMVRAGRYAGAGVVRADAGRLPLTPAGADAVTAGFLLHVLPPEVRAAVVAEAARVLRPGGLLGVVVPAEPRGALRRLVRRVTRAVLSVRGGAGVLTVPGDLDGLLSAAGFEVVADGMTGAGYWSRVCVARRTGDPRPA